MDDRRLEIQIGALLRAGVLGAAAIVTLGALVYLIQHHGEFVHYGSFHEEGPDLTTLAGISRGALHLHSVALIQLGVLLLIATPIARVVFAVVGFALERDRLYVIVSAIVLAILVFSLLHAT
jgi:uncharacterized membrane protein